MHDCPPHLSSVWILVGFPSLQIALSWVLEPRQPFSLDTKGYRDLGDPQHLTHP